MCPTDPDRERHEEVQAVQSSRHLPPPPSECSARRYAMLPRRLRPSCGGVPRAAGRQRRSHRASGRASMRRPAAPQRRTQVVGQQRRHAMSTATVRTPLVLVLALLVFGVLGATSSAFACVVGTGTSASCTEVALDACLPGGASFNGTVTFNCGGAATITVTSTKGFNGANTTIDGGGVITISGGNMSGVFAVNRGRALALANVTIAGGTPSAIENNGGTLTVTNCTFSGNGAVVGASGGAIFSNGTTNVTNSTFSGNSGGAIRVADFGTTNVTNSTFSGNSGGAISNGSLFPLTVTNCTFSGN